MNRMKEIAEILFVLSVFLCVTSCKEDEPGISVEDTNTHAGHEYVDLGLPSGALWATADVNVDGSVFFSWGETTPKSSYMSGTYRYLAGADSTLTKYCTDALCGNDGFIDGLFELKPEDDAAHVNWGGRLVYAGLG